MTEQILNNHLVRKMTYVSLPTDILKEDNFEFPDLKAVVPKQSTLVTN